MNSNDVAVLRKKAIEIGLYQSKADKSLYFNNNGVVKFVSDKNTIVNGKVYSNLNIASKAMDKINKW